VSRITRPWRFVVPLALVLLAADLVSAFLSNSSDDPVLFGVLAGLAGTAFVASGLIAWHRRPDNATGRQLTLVGLAWLLFSSLWNANNELLYTLGSVFGFFPIVALLHLVVVYPQGRATTRLERAFVTSMYPVALAAGVLPALFQKDLSGGDCSNCPDNVFLISSQPSVWHALDDVFSVVGIFYFLGAVALTVHRWRSATPAMRRVLLPVYLTGGVSVAAVGLAFGAGFVSGTVQTVLWVIALIGVITLPFAFLGGLVRTRLMLGVRRLLDYADEPTTEDAQEAIRKALGDPTARLGYWLERGGGYVDVHGNPFPLREDGGGRASTPIASRQGPLGFIEHDATLVTHEPELLAQVVMAYRITLEKDRGRQVLRASDEQSRALLDALPDLMIRFRRDGTYLDIQGNTSGLVRAPAELIGRNVWDLLPGEVVGPLMHCAERALERGASESIEYRLEVRGQLRDFEARMVPSGDDEIISIVRDFTEQRSLESELHARLEEIEREQAFTRTVVQTAPIVFLLVDDQGRIVRFNETCERLFGYRDDESTRGRHFWEVFVAPDYFDAATRSLDRLSAGEPIVEYECRWLSKDGAPRTISVNGAPIFDGRGKLHYLICGLDVTERERHLAELRASRARLVEAEDAERRRLERNLHDGAQQRLVSISLALRLAQAKLASDHKAAGDILVRAGEELALALEELRELARGIHPAVLSDHGLAAALESLAGRSPVPVHVSSVPQERLPAPVEAAAFYVVSESLANVAKYAQASHARVSVTRMNGRAVVEVFDDGVGGADPERGSGLRGLVDRIEALDGSLQVSSPPGGGTTVHAEIPWAS
jgi:PAS domain S-box-containing protein